MLLRSLMQRIFSCSAAAMIFVSACAPVEEPDVALEFSDQAVAIGRDFDAIVTVTAPDREVCVHSIPEEAFFWTSSLIMDRRSKPFVLADRHSEVKCLDPGESHVYRVSLLFSELGERYLLTMNGLDVGTFETLSGLELGVTFHPVEEPFGSSYEGYSTWPKVALSLESRPSE